MRQVQLENHLEVEEEITQQANMAEVQKVLLQAQKAVRKENNQKYARLVFANRAFIFYAIKF
jgi:hypothetical protein